MRERACFFLLLWLTTSCGADVNRSRLVGTWRMNGEVTIGLMRPTDTMATLFEPPPTKNPFRWMEYRVHGGDTDLELSRQLTQRLKKHGRVNDWRDHVKTLDDFVRAWCGSPPAVAAAGA